MSGRGAGTSPASTSPAKASPARAGPAVAAAVLEPVRSRLRAVARAEAGRIRDEGRRAADSIRAQARQAAAEAAAAASAAGRAQAEALAGAELARARAAAAAVALTGQREDYEELRARVRAGVLALAAEPGWDRLSARLAGLARQAAGPGAVLTADPAGGWTARGPAAVADCSLPRLAELAVEALGADVAGMWES